MTDPVLPELDDRDASLIWLRNAKDVPEVEARHYVETALRWQARHGELPPDVWHEFTMAARAIVAMQLQAIGLHPADAQLRAARGQLRVGLTHDHLDITWIPPEGDTP